MPSLFNRPESKKKRRYLRQNLTKSEKLLWAKLRKCQLKGLRFRRQYGVLNYVVDFYCPEYKLVDCNIGLDSVLPPYEGGS